MSEMLLLASSYFPVRQSILYNSVPNGRIILKFYIRLFFYIMLGKLKFI